MQETARTARRPRVRSAVVASQAPWLVKVGARRLKARSVPVGRRFARFAVDVSAWYSGDRGGDAAAPPAGCCCFGEEGSRCCSSWSCGC
uniref:Uncharacterized protein n=1 Tax=Arundo donax TaxID=35708 RepID=A0A0A9HF31_ARUDO